MYCKDCKHRALDRQCLNEDKIAEDYGLGYGENDDMLLYSYMEGGSFSVGDNFGCVHFAAKSTDSEQESA